MTDETYNGWTNRETWLVNLWIGNDEGSNAYWNERATENVGYAKERLKEVDDTPEEVRAESIRNLADILEEEIGEVVGIDKASLAADLMTTALARVNWREIAEALYNDNDN